jgi:hypothetical protein
MSHRQLDRIGIHWKAGMSNDDFTFWIHNSLNALCANQWILAEMIDALQQEVEQVKRMLPATPTHQLLHASAARRHP